LTFWSLDLFVIQSRPVFRLRKTVAVLAGACRMSPFAMFSTQVPRAVSRTISGTILRPILPNRATVGNASGQTWDYCTNVVL